MHCSRCGHSRRSMCFAESHLSRWSCTTRRERSSAVARTTRSFRLGPSSSSNKARFRRSFCSSCAASGTSAFRCSSRSADSASISRSRGDASGSGSGRSRSDVFCGSTRCISPSCCWASAGRSSAGSLQALINRRSPPRTSPDISCCGSTPSRKASRRSASIRRSGLSPFRLTFASCTPPALSF